MEIFKIDATNKILGRLAGEVSLLLRGKDKKDFALNSAVDRLVYVYNLENIRVTGKKYKNKVYFHHTGYLGGLKSKKYAEIFEKDPVWIFKKAIYAMIPKNKLRPIFMNHLKLFNADIKH